MKLLVLTQKVDKNDPILGFFHKWLEEFSKHYEKVTVICLERGTYDLPQNVSLYSLGKENKKSRFVYTINFYKYILKLRKDYNTVFVHMNPEYIVLGGIPWRLMGKRVGLWYVHRQTNLKLRIASMFSNVIMSSSKESFRLKSKKVYFLGHGIDTGVFTPSGWNKDSRLLLHVGRITEIKHCEVLLEALKELRTSDPSWTAEFVGETVTSKDKSYLIRLKNYINDNKLGDAVTFKGSLTPEEIRGRLEAAFATVNMTPSGGMDKVVLESLSTGCPAFTANTAFKNVFEAHSDTFIYKYGDAHDLFNKVLKFRELPNNMSVTESLCEETRKRYSVGGIVEKISKILNE